MKDIRKGFTLSTHFRGKPPQTDEWVSQAEAARMRGVSRQAIARLIKKGRFRILEIGGKVLLRREDIEAYRPEAPGRPPNE
jgi:excisionase family DNA binding protein